MPQVTRMQKKNDKSISLLRSLIRENVYADPFIFGICDVNGYVTPMGTFLSRIGVMSSGIDESTLSPEQTEHAHMLEELGLVSKKLSPRGFTSYTVTQKGSDALLAIRDSAPKSYLK